jgi:hypothetical protein
MLNSQLITGGHSFHTVHITDLIKLLRKGLGYMIYNEYCGVAKCKSPSILS